MLVRTFSSDQVCSRVSLSVLPLFKIRAQSRPFRRLASPDGLLLPLTLY
jgi:hypothetical protein